MKIKTIKLSLLERVSEIKNSTGKADYLKKKTVKFELPSKFSKYLYESLVSQMYEDLLSEVNTGDSVGLWIEYENGDIIENAISINTLKDIKAYSSIDINPAYEFFKMTINQK